MSERILFDEARDARIGLPEAVFSEGKDPESLKELLLRFRRGCGHPILFTRLSVKALEALPEDVREGYSYDPISRTAYGKKMPERGEIMARLPLSRQEPLTPLSRTKLAARLSISG